MTLITRRLVKTQVTDNDVDDQRDNLFHTRCLVKGTACSLVIDSESCTNVVSTMLIKRLQIPTEELSEKIEKNQREKIVKRTMKKEKKGEVEERKRVVWLELERS